MGNLLHAERYKLFHDKTYWVILAVTVLFNASIFLGNSVASMTGQAALTESIKKAVGSAMIACIYGGTFLGGDFAGRTLYHGLTAGKSRGTILMAKGIVFAFAADGLLFLFPLLFTLACTLKNGWGTTVSAGLALHLIAAAVALLILGFGVSAISVLAAACCRNIGGTLGIPIILNFVMIVLLNSSLAITFFRFFPISAMFLVVNGNVKPAYGMGLGILWTGVLFAVSSLIFRRAELR